MREAVPTEPVWISLILDEALFCRIPRRGKRTALLGVDVMVTNKEMRGLLAEPLPSDLNLESFFAR
jgi:hypothetical protein